MFFSVSEESHTEKAPHRWELVVALRALARQRRGTYGLCQCSPVPPSERLTQGNPPLPSSLSLAPPSFFSPQTTPWLRIELKPKPQGTLERSRVTTSPTSSLHSGVLGLKVSRSLENCRGTTWN